MPREPKRSRKSGGRAPKVYRKGNEASRLPPSEDGGGVEEQKSMRWERSMGAFLSQNLISYLTKTHLSPENQEILKEVVKEYDQKLENHFYSEHSHTDAWHRVLEKFNHRT